MYYLQWAIRLDPKLKVSAAQDSDLEPLRKRDDFKQLTITTGTGK